MNDAVLEALWKNVLDHWENDGAHQAFLEHCQASDRLVEAAVRYRGMQGDRDRGAVAEKRLGAVALLALSKLEIARGPRPGRSNIAKLAAITFFLAGSALLIGYLLQTH